MTTLEQLVIGAIIGAFSGWAVAYIQHRRRRKRIDKMVKDILAMLDKLSDSLDQGD